MCGKLSAASWLWPLQEEFAAHSVDACRLPRKACQRRWSCARVGVEAAKAAGMMPEHSPVPPEACRGPRVEGRRPASDCADVAHFWDWKKVSQDIFKCIKTIPPSQDEARKYQDTPSCDIQMLSCDGAISAHSTVSQHVRLMTEGTHLEMCVPRQHNFISLSGVASRGSDISRRPCVLT